MTGGLAHERLSFVGVRCAGPDGDGDQSSLTTTTTSITNQSHRVGREEEIMQCNMDSPFMPCIRRLGICGRRRLSYMSSPKAAHGVPTAAPTIPCTVYNREDTAAGQPRHRQDTRTHLSICWSLPLPPGAGGLSTQHAESITISSFSRGDDAAAANGSGFRSNRSIHGRCCQQHLSIKCVVRKASMIKMRETR